MFVRVVVVEDVCVVDIDAPAVFGAAVFGAAGTVGGGLSGEPPPIAEIFVIACLQSCMILCSLAHFVKPVLGFVDLDHPISLA